MPCKIALVLIAVHGTPSPALPAKGREPEGSSTKVVNKKGAGRIIKSVAIVTCSIASFKTLD